MFGVKVARKVSVETVDYYNNNAESFVTSTEKLDMSALYTEFLPHVIAGGHILDAGCGSGRDARYFKQQGFNVSAFDASSEMASFASQRLGQPVQTLTFEQLNEQNKYDGIWCCASLLHVARQRLPAVFIRLQNAMKHRAVLYLSFKYGDCEREVNGRYFTDMTEAQLAAIITDIAGLTLYKTWLTKDQRTERNDETWLNALISKDT